MAYEGTRPNSGQYMVTRPGQSWGTFWPDATNFNAIRSVRGQNGGNGGAQTPPPPLGGGALATNYTPNAFTQAQLGSGQSMLSPEWMMNAYQNKITGMGGNANQAPFGITQSGFPQFAPMMQPPTQQPTTQPTPVPGMGGKISPNMNTTLQGIGNSGMNAINTLGAIMGPK